MQQHTFNLHNQSKEPNKLKLNMNKRIYLEGNYHDKHYDQDHQHHVLQGEELGGGGGGRTKTLKGREMEQGNDN